MSRTAGPDGVATSGTVGPKLGAGVDLLRAIVAATRASVDARRRTTSDGEIERAAAARMPKAAEFMARLNRPDQVNVIAECKRRSPSRGVLCRDYDPARLATAYARGGAAAVSVLTEPTFFDGALEHLREVRATVELPILGKDFIVTEYQLVEARAAGADAALLIVGALDDAMLRRLLAAADGLDLAALVEVHDAAELDRALDAGARLVGVNNRNLRTLEVAVDTSVQLIERIPDGVCAVAESGLRSSGDLAMLRSFGYRAFLVGEALAADADPARALEALRDV
ncbi:MAG: indole-3-glycerol phosphate synthase TrpC [Vicinamibacterales bacterium]|nr:indole-3-glycerol phosphate synthase TrpC [Vicinamibacterales bacterium]MDP7671977.1 indole-3-glycerol phosphate synthase TrpC [Vicinamibacterales bacterium]HJO37194.1 indole-3-glycerol phosphate synthase TrpC [Vicinamibacterales bacterium]